MKIANATFVNSCSEECSWPAVSERFCRERVVGVPQSADGVISSDIEKMVGDVLAYTRKFEQGNPKNFFLTIEVQTKDG